MNAIRALIVVSAVVVTPLIGGCGSSSAASSKPLANPLLLNGNWLITGDLPQLGIPFPTRNFGVSVTLDAFDGKVYAQVADFFPCSGGGSNGGSTYFTPAAIEPDGTFVLTSLGVIGFPTTLLNIKGIVPKENDASWSGAYSAINTNSGCLPMSGAFTATRLPPITGTFIGTVSLQASAFVPPAPTPPVSATVTLTLQQGGPSSLDPPQIAAFDSVNALTGTIDIQGTPCPRAGTLTIPLGSVFGSNFSGTFVMEDGSRLTLRGYAEDAPSSAVRIAMVSITGGTCDKWFSISNSELVKQ